MNQKFFHGFQLKTTDPGIQTLGQPTGHYGLVRSESLPPKPKPERKAGKAMQQGLRSSPLKERGNAGSFTRSTNSMKILVACLMIGALLFCSASVSAIMRAESKKQPIQNHGKSLESVNSIRRATELMQEVQKGILYTNNGQYDLTGVRIIDHAEDNRVKEPTGGRKRVVEMVFVNKALKEVIIHK